MTAITTSQRGSISDSPPKPKSSSKRGSASSATPAANYASTLTPQQLESISDAEVFDQDGKKYTWGELTGGKRVVVVFIRHFWCINCKEYLRLLAAQIPPSSLPEGTSLIAIGCGQYKPLKTYIPTLTPNSASPYPYPVYAHPSLALHKGLGFMTSLDRSKAGEEKAYEAALGGIVKRTFAAIKEVHIGEAGQTGPLAQNGGEVVMEADGSCSFLHRMKHTVDHTELDTLAAQIGARHIPGQSMSDAMVCPA